jgi:hypothetical protein
MTPAINTRLLEQIDAPASRLLRLPERAAATIATVDGRYITSGIAEIVSDGELWHARLRHLEQPGCVATLYFSQGVREVELRLEDGRRGTALISGTSFTADAQRVCDLRGLQPLT